MTTDTKTKYRILKKHDRYVVEILVTFLGFQWYAAHENAADCTTYHTSLAEAESVKEELIRGDLVARDPGKVVG